MRRRAQEEARERPSAYSRRLRGTGKTGPAAAARDLPGAGSEIAGDFPTTNAQDCPKPDHLSSEKSRKKWTAN
jgi:hypothetical protein